MPHLVWFKRDLRIQDHAALLGAAERGEVLALYVYEPEQYRHPEFHPAHLSVLNDALAEVRARLGELGIPLLLRHGEAVAVLEALWQEVPFSSLWAHQETGNWVSYQRDRRVRAWAKGRGLPFYEPPQNGVVRRLRSRDTWAEEWEARMGTAPRPAPGRLCGPQHLTPGDLLWHRDLNLPENDKALPWPPGAFGEHLAHTTLYSFLNGRGVNYTREMSSPLTAEHACSRLSVHLAFGTLSLRTVVHATRQRLAAVTGDPQADPRWVRSLRSFESRLHWHCHFMQRLESEPQMEFRGLNPTLADLRPEELDEEARTKFDAWASGRTGFPMVDACMRMLLATGWLPFRMRALLVSFATEQLWLPWRAVGLHLARHWLDNEPGIHWSQVQMQSGMVGINTLRIYNPTKQARDQDPDGEFLRAWLPELRSLPPAYVHEPHLTPPLVQAEIDFRVGDSYPLPIVDDREAVRAAKQRHRQAQARDPGREVARQVYERHGSRKKAQLRAEGRMAPSRRRQRPTVQASPAPATSTRPVLTPGQPLLFDTLVPEQPSVELPRLPADWQAVLGPVMGRPAFRELLAFVASERERGPVYPPEPDVFAALHLTALKEVRVVILGQDPYHGPGQAQGLAFSVRPGMRVPPSLANIHRELAADLGCPVPRHGDLRAWARQGVLLLNTVLTVRQGEPGSHANRGWETFTDAVIRAVNGRPERVVFLLWGAHARRKARLVTAPHHVVLEAGHPSPLSAARFLGSRPFSQANAALREAGRGEVSWCLPERTTAQ